VYILHQKNDFFILFTTSENYNIKLPERSGIVYEKNFKEYFGPFANRAIRHARIRTSIPILSSNSSVNLVGEKRANIINHLKILRKE
jgi:hypothetical protein